MICRVSTGSQQGQLGLRLEQIKPEAHSCNGPVASSDLEQISGSVVRNGKQGHWKGGMGARDAKGKVTHLVGEVAPGSAAEVIQAALRRGEGGEEGHQWVGIILIQCGATVAEGHLPALAGHHSAPPPAGPS